MIEEQFVSFDTTKMLKEAGFNETCRYSYDNVGGFRWFKIGGSTPKGWVPCPTQALAARWLREVHGIHVYAIQTNLPYTEPQTTKWEWGYVIDNIDDPNSNVAICEMYFGSYEAAFEAGLQESIKLIKK